MMRDWSTFDHRQEDTVVVLSLKNIPDIDITVDNDMTNIIYIYVKSILFTVIYA